jgi:gliding motility-associated-like protein
MKKKLLTFLLLFIYTNLLSQVGTGPATDCTSSIPEICPGGSYPASVTGTATAPGASFACPGTTPITGQPAFFFIEIGTAGNIDLVMDPVDPFTGALLSTPQDLDFIAWGPFTNTANMCTQLQAANRIDCSFSNAASEMCNIVGANVGDLYVIEVSNWHTSGTPNFCHIQFSTNTTAGGVANPFAGGGFAGAYTNIYICSSDSIFNLIDVMNGFPDTWGTWYDDTWNIVSNSFDPATDQGGAYKYVIGGTTNCPGDTADLDITLFNSSSVSITSTPNACSDDLSFTLTATPAGGLFSGIGVSGTTFTPDQSNVGVNTISYTYTPAGCLPIIATQSLTVNESPTVLSANALTTNPLCFGDCNGTAIITASLGLGPYSYDWDGENPLSLCSGAFNYTVTDQNGCDFFGDVTLYDPINNLGVLTPYNSSCYGDNNGGISIVMNGGTTPPGTVSLLSYCLSSTAIDFTTGGAPNQDATIEEVILIGDANTINNNTAGVIDYYEDYTATMYADITEGGSYAVDLILGDFSGGSYPSGAKVFIDYNIDGDFDDAGEEIGILNSTGTSPNIGSINFTVPTTGAFGPTRMRVVSQDPWSNGGTSNIGPCDYADPAITNNAPWFGATEDYSIVLNAPALTASFLWNNGQTTNNAYNLGPGTYTVTITPSNGCAVQDSAIVLEPAEITFSPTITQISCNTFTDGQISLNTSGGNGGPYTPDWGTINPLALDSGYYTVTVSDPSTITTTNQVACENDTIIVMVEPAYFSVDFTTSDDTICLNDAVTLDFNFNQGGVPNFTINYTENGNPQSAGPFNSIGQQSVNISPNAGPNTYIITSITDSAGCINQNTITSQNIFVNPLPDINIAVAPSPICVGDDAILTFSAVNGKPPYVVDYLIGGTPAQEDPVTGAGSSLSVSPTTTTTYALTFVTDSLGCEAYLTDNTTLVVNEIPQVTLTSPTEICDYDIIQLKFNFTAGTAPWMINYNINSTNTIIPIYNAIDSISISPSSTTIYTINSVTDNNNCKNNTSQTITITTHPLPEIVLSGGGSICDDGSTTNIIFTTSSGSPPYDLAYSAGLNSNFVSNIGNIYTITTNQAGVYTIQNIIDSEGCKGTTISGSAFVNINPLPEANITTYPQPANILNPVINFIDMSNGHTTGEWNFADGNTLTITNPNDKINHTYSDTGTYPVSLSIKSDSGCIAVAWQTIIISEAITVYIPNAFTPNNDLNNDYFLPIVGGVNEYEFSIYDRSGNRVFSTDKTNVAWDGKINNEYVTKGVYLYALVFTDINGKLRTYEGTVTLIR